MQHLSLKRKPGRPSLSDSEKKEIKNNIIDIARDLFINQGYENTSMRKIAGQAGFAPTKIYYYFDNKKAILKHFWEDIARDLWRYCQPSQALLEGDPLDIIRHLMTQSIHYWLSHPKSYQLGIATQDFSADQEENFDIYSAEGTRNYIELMHRSVQQCIDDQLFWIKDKLVASQVIALSVYGTYGAFYALPTVHWENKETLISHAVENTLRGLLSQQA